MIVKTAFLNENFYEDAYMTLLEGLESKKFTNKICKL